MSSAPYQNEPSDKKVLISALGWLGVIFVFLFILAVAYLPNRPVSIEEREAEIRYGILRNVQEEQARIVDSYAWVNQGEGVVRIPIERSMRLVVNELRERQLAEGEAPLSR